MKVLKTLNLGIGFILELCMLASLEYWGFQNGKSLQIKITIGVGITIVVLVLWALFAASNSKYRLKLRYRILFESVCFILAAAALFDTGKIALSIALVAIAALNEGLALWWKQ